jgi:subtilisin family serine protease
VCLGVISVGAVDSALTVSSFSSRHTYLDLTAPGEQIPTLSRETRSAFIGDGTSQATALAAGAVAMVWSKFPAASNSQIASRVIASAIDRGLPGRDSAYGYGVIDPAAAIAANAAAARPNPVFAGAQPLLSLMTPAPPVPGIAPAGTASATLGSFRRGSTAVPAGLSVYLPAGVAVLFVVLAALLLVRTFRRPRPRPVTARSG